MLIQSVLVGAGASVQLPRPLRRSGPLGRRRHPAGPRERKAPLGVQGARRGLGKYDRSTTQRVDQGDVWSRVATYEQAYGPSATSSIVEVLADAIVRAEMQSVVPVGFSLGGRVMAAAAESLATRSDETPRVETMHLLGAAVGTHRNWRSIEPAVGGTIFNYFSKSGRILSALYRVAEGGTKSIGAEGIPTKSPRLKNVDVSKKVGGHAEHLRAVSLRRGPQFPSA